MGELLTFRRRRARVAFGIAGAAAACPVLLWHASLLPLGVHRAEVVRACLLAAAAVGVFGAVGVWRAVRERVVLSDDALTLRGLVGQRVVPWASVVELAAPWGLYADVPLVLRLRPRPGGILGACPGIPVGCVAGVSGADARRGDTGDAMERIAEETQRGRRPADAATRRDAATSGRRRCRTSSAMPSAASPPPCSSPPARIAGVAASRGFLDRLLARLLPRRVNLGGHWADHERLVREVVARAPHAGVNRRLSEYLADPGRLPWGHRLAALLSLGASVGLGAHALADALAEGVVGVVEGAAVVLAAAACALTGGSMGREGRAKSALVAAYVVLVVAAAAVSVPALLHGHSDWLLLLLAGCVGWAAATLAVCLPIRLRPLTVAAAYAVAVAAAVALAWRLGVREPVAVSSVGPLRLASRTLVWSPDGATLGLHVGEPGRAGEAYLLVGASGRQAQRLPVTGLAERLCLPSERHALYVTSLFRRSRDWSLGSARALWAWEAAWGEPRRVPVAARLRLAEEGLASPDGQRVAFLALDDSSRRWRLHVLRLADLAVSRPESPFDFSRFAKVRWACDGGLVLTEHHEGWARGPDRLALWWLAPGGAAPERFYEASAAELWDRYSPDRRWALVALFDGGRRRARFDLVDLRARKSRRVEFPGGPYPHWLAWAADGAALAYAAPDSGGHAVVRFDPATGDVRRVPLTLRGTVLSVALSSGGRFAACVVQGERAARVQVADLATGRVVTLRRPLLFLPMPTEPAWSPVGQTLAVASYESTLPPAPTVRLCLFEFGDGW